MHVCLTLIVIEKCQVEVNLQFWFAKRLSCYFVQGSSSLPPGSQYTRSIPVFLNCYQNHLVTVIGHWEMTFQNHFLQKNKCQKFSYHLTTLYFLWKGKLSELNATVVCAVHKAVTGLLGHTLLKRWRSAQWSENVTKLENINI